MSSLGAYIQDRTSVVTEAQTVNIGLASGHFTV